MRSTHPEDQRGPRPAWNGIGFGLVAVAVVLFVLFAPANRAPEEQSPNPTISLDDLRAMLTDAPGETPPTFLLETPDGPVTVVVPTTTTEGQAGGGGTPAPVPTTSTTTTTTTAPPSTTVPRAPRDPLEVGGGIIDDLLGAAVPTTTEVVDE